MSERLSKIAFFSSVLFLLAAGTFIYGVAIGNYKIWPHEKLEEVAYVITSFMKWGEFVPKGRRVVAPPDASRETFTIHTPALVSGGHYVFLGWDHNSARYAAWLYDAKGELLHTWHVDYSALDPDGPLNNRDNPHAFHVLSDGSIIVGFDHGDIMVRLNTCSQPVWIKRGIFHHSLEPAEAGRLWTWRGEGTAYGHYNYMEQFDAETGEAVDELALVEDIMMNMGPDSAIFGVRPDHPFERFERTPENKIEVDLFHPNDVEELSPRLAPAFPMFEAGDLLLSFRTLHLVMVVDPDDYRVKWWSHGPWRFQHDPDFTNDGKISVFSNNTGTDRSEILKIDPKTREITNPFYMGDFHFSTSARGKHQYLNNGNILVIIPGEGRAVELSSDGNKVLEFNNISPDWKNYNEDVVNGLWLEPGYFTTLPKCER